MLHERVDPPIGRYSVGLHPWFADHYSPQEINVILEEFAGDQNMIALGETGLDKSCHIPMQIQQDIFEIHLKNAAKQNKPVVLHCVKAWEEIIEQTSHFSMTKVLHGYNGSAELTKRLLNHNFLFSIGTAILNPKAKIQSAIQTIPVSSLFCETDTFELHIEEIYTALSDKIHENKVKFKEAVFANFSILLCL
jgi:TatD DNase family protein